MGEDLCVRGVLLSCSAGGIGVLIAVVLAIATAAILVGVRAYRPPGAHLWRMLAVALGVMVAGRVATLVAAAAGAPDGLANAFAGIGLVIGIVMMLVSAHGFVFGVVADRDATIDALVVASAACLGLWQLVVVPEFAAAGVAIDALPRAVGLAATLTLAAFLRLSFALRPTVSGHVFLIGGGIGVLGTILALVPEPHPATVVAVVLSWVTCLLAVAVSALHPSMRLVHDTLTGPVRTGRVRLLLVIAAIVVAAPFSMLDLAPDSSADFAFEATVVLAIVVVGSWRVLQLLRADERAAAQASRQLELQGAIAELGRRTLTVSEPQAFVDLSVATAVEMLGADGAAMLEILADGHLRYRGAVGFPGHTVALDRVARDGTLAGASLAAGGPVVVDDLLADRRFPASMGLRSAGFVSGVVLPVEGRETCHGVLGVFSRTKRRFTEDEIGFLEVAGNFLSGALDRGEVEARLRQQALRDPLTRLPNRRLLLQRLETACSRARGDGPTVIAIEIDGVGVVNDTLGHDAGEELVLAVAERLATCFATSDTLARYSDDTFVGVWTGPPSARDDLVAIVAAALSPPFPVSEGEVFVRATIGTAVGGPGVSAPELLRQADLALLWAKRERTWQAAFEPRMAVAVQQRLQLETDLRHAIERDEFECHYQPQVDLVSGAPVGFEALIRWHHPRDGLVPPGAFIEVAEQTGLIAALDRWVLQAACRQIREWTDAGIDVGRVSVNVSAATLQHGDLPQRLAAVLAETRVSPERLEIEITESSVMQRPDEALATLRALRDTGVRIAVDDFGTGYSSLSYLQRFPVDTLKIDRSFVSTLDASSAAADNGILAAIVAVSRHLGLGLVAEGIETPTQRDILQALGCDVAQGYFYARPLPADQLDAWLLRSGAAIS